MQGGYMGKILRVDLSRGSWETDTIGDETCRKFIGGRGLGIWFLSREAPADVDPYAEDNPLIFMTGPYTGTGVFSAFYNVTTKSPLTGLAASSHSGGSWGPWLKRAGFDAIVIRGKSETPCYLAVEDGACRILNAHGLWGKGVKETEAVLKDRHGKVEVACIGPAGEKRVRFASIMNDVHRAAGRGGVGAVMGAKNLKAVAVGGNQRIPYRDRSAFTALSRTGAQKALKNATAFAKYGTSLVFSLMNSKGVLPTRNFRAGHFEHADRINGDALKSRFFVRDKGCFNCPLKCANIHTVPDGAYRVFETEGPEYETLMSFGSNCGNSDLASIIKANDVCNDLGMDTISAGNTIALLLDLEDRGLLGSKATGAMELGWGNAEAMIALLGMIAHREGVGDLLAEGSVQAARQLGDGCEWFTVHTKGQEFPGYEVRRAQGTGLSFATNNRGADHLRGCLYVEEIFQGKLDPMGWSDEKIRTLVQKENFLALVDSLVMCKFGQRNGEFTPDVLAEVLGRLTGAAFSVDELLDVGERIWNLERSYNGSAGASPDELPERLFQEDLQDGVEGGARIPQAEFRAAVQRYYQERQWDPSGNPAVRKLEALDLR
jgi:aldehyde:ferredoxin oxidoreductase